MAIFKNEGKGISILLKADYSQVQLKENEHINIEEKLVLNYPKAIKKYSEDEWRKLNTLKVKEKPTLVKKAESKKEPKQTEETEKLEEVKVKETPKKTTRRGRKSNKGITNA